MNVCELGILISSTDFKDILKTRTTVGTDYSFTSFC